MVQTVKNLPGMWNTWVQTLGWEESLKKGMATLSSLLSWRIPWTEEPDSLWGRKESNTTEQLTLSFHFKTLFTVCGYQLLTKPLVVVTGEWTKGRSVMSDSLQPHGCSLPGSSVHGIVQARILEWVVISSPSYWYISPNTLVPFTSRRMIELYFPDPVKLVVTTWLLLGNKMWMEVTCHPLGRKL